MEGKIRTGNIFKNLKMLLNCFVVLAVLTQTSLVKTVHVTKSIWVFGKQICEIQDDRKLIRHKALGIQEQLHWRQRICKAMSNEELVVTVRTREG